MNKLLFLSFLLILPISCFADGGLILQTSDGEQIECTQEQQAILMQSRTIKNMLENMGDEDESTVPLADISAKTFNQIMQCLKPLAEMETLKAELKALQGRDKKDKEEEIEAKESEIIKQLNSYSENDLFNVIQATSFLAIPALLDYACLIWSDNYELKRFENNTPSFNNQEIIEKLQNINFLSIKSFFIKKYFENYTPDVKILRHDHWVESLSYSPDGTQIASASNDRTVYICDAETGECLRTLRGHDGSVLSVSYSPDGAQIASASHDNTIRIWDAQTGDCLHTLNGHTRWVKSVSYSPDGTQIASASDDNTIRIWDAQTGDCLHTLNGHTNLVNATSYSPDGTQIASASCDKTVRIWDATTGQYLHTLGHFDWVNSVSYSQDGTQIASGSGDGTVRIWDAQTGVYLQTLSDGAGWVNSVSYSPDGAQIASGFDGTIRIWDAKTGECLHTLKGHKHSVCSASYSPDGTQLASASYDKTVRIWDIGKPVRNLENKKYEQLLLHALCKKAVEKKKTLHIANNSHLLGVLNSLPNKQQAFLQEITPMKLQLTKQILLRLYNYRKPIAAAGAIGLGSLALYASWKLLKN